jgi:hypothetical protein
LAARRVHDVTGRQVHAAEQRQDQASSVQQASGVCAIHPVL